MNGPRKNQEKEYMAVADVIQWLQHEFEHSGLLQTTFTCEWINAFVEGPGTMQYIDTLMRGQSVSHVAIALLRDAVDAHAGVCPLIGSAKTPLVLYKFVAPGEWGVATIDDVGTVLRAVRVRLLRDYEQWGEIHAEEIHQSELLHRRYHRAILKIANMSVCHPAIVRALYKFLKR